MKSLLLFVLLAGLVALKQDVEIIKWAALESYIDQKNDKVKVINFWATWCRPCMEELPYFERIHQQYKDQQVEVLLVSLDQAGMKDKVKASMVKNNITARVVLLDEVDFNKWIDKVDTTWSGAIPATLIITKQNTNKQFYEKEFNFQELDQLIHSLNP